MKYSIDQLPYNDFIKIGMDRDSVLSLPQSTINALLSGNRTSLIRFENIKLDSGGYTQLDAKLSLERKANGDLGLNIHTVNEKLEKTLGLSEKEISYLQRNDLSFVPVKIQKDGKEVDALATYDATTNEIVAIDQENLKAPDYINDQALSPQQKEDFICGKPILVNGKKYTLNPHNEFGVSGHDLMSVQLGHSKYRMENVSIDALVITAGLGHYVMLYHFANMLLNTRGKEISIERSLNNVQFRNAVKEARDEILAKRDIVAKSPAPSPNKLASKLTVDEIKDILERKPVRMLFSTRLMLMTLIAPASNRRK